MGFRISSQLVTLALWSLSLTNLSYGAPTAQDPCTALLKYADESAVRVPAKDAYACLLSPPFNQTRSANVHEQIRRLANILSSQAFFNDPKGLPLIVDRVDLNGTFNAIKKKIDGNTYQNDYQFNRDLTELFGGYHDGHTLYWPNCMGVFGQFQHDYPLVSIVPPGEDTPRIYLADPKSGEVGEEITEIAGDPALEHLLKLVKVLKGPFDASWIDADTRWNGLFVGRDALGIQMGNFAGRDMYPGPDFKMKTASGKTIEVKWYVPGPSTWASSDYWKELFQSTDSYVTGFCIAPPTTSSTTTETPEGTETEDVPTDVPEQTETEDEPTDEITDDNSDYDGTTDETTEYPDDGTDDTSDYAGTTDETESFIVEIDDDETSEYSTEEETTIEGASRASPRPHRTAKSHSASHKYPVHPNFGYLDYITKRSPLNRREDFDVDWRKELRARGDGNTVEDFSGLQVTDIPPVAYPAVTTRLNGTEQSLHFLKSHPDVAVWGFHSFASRESVQPNNVQFFYYWRSYMIENLKLLKKQGVKRLILDMSNNGGGSVVLGMETVRRFFPEAEPFYGVDYRRSPLVDEFLYLTNVTTGLNQLDGKPFKSFEDFLSPPVSKKGDYFTKIGRFNQLGDSQQEIPGVEFTFKGDPPFAKENVVILTDGQCGSTCAITVEALASIGIATVVTGGQPSASGNKAMQYIGGIKGYQVLEFTDLEVSPEDPLNNQVTPELEPYVVRPIEISFMARCNLRNSYTPDDHIIPQEFIFQPADAHVWYTKQMINDKTILWNDVVKLTWDDKGVNKLLKARGGSDKKQGKAGAHHKVGTHLKQPQAGYKGRRTRETLKTGVLADLKYLASGWLGGWGGKD